MTGFALAVAAIGVTLSGSALADRHCTPIQYRYYDARKALHETDVTCPARLAKALDFMREAAAEAAACGCSAFEAELQEFIDDLPTTDEHCGVAEKDILKLDERLSESVANCN